MKTLALICLFLAVASARASTCAYECDVSYKDIYSSIDGLASSYDINALEVECKALGKIWSLESSDGEPYFSCYTYESTKFNVSGAGDTIPNAEKVARDSCFTQGQAIISSRKTDSRYSHVGATNLQCSL